jgi:hypothetical protein
MPITRERCLYTRSDRRRGLGGKLLTDHDPRE